MKTVLIINSDIDKLEALMDICRLGSSNFTILSAQDETGAHVQIKEKRIDLIICSSTFPNHPECLVPAHLARDYPYIPLIVVAPPDTIAPERVHAFGASALFSFPIDAQQLLEQITELTNQSSTGSINGIPIHSFLQMLENEDTSCTLHVSSHYSAGLIFIKEGRVINAETGNLRAEQAMYEIISWNDVVIEVLYFNGQRRKEITAPLISLIMEAFRLKDEQEERKKNEQETKAPRQQLQQFSATGHRMALDIGLPLKIEFPRIETSLESSLVGMIPDNCLIVTTPAHFLITQAPLAVGAILLVKFHSAGKLCLFKSKLLMALKEPYPMLFLEYPIVIHYHEVRRTKRTAIHIPCTLTIDNGQHYYGTIINISSSGGLCSLKRSRNHTIPEININRNITINCLLPGLPEDQHIPAQIKNIAQNERDLQIGLEFSTLDPDLQKTITTYLKTIENDS